MTNTLIEYHFDGDTGIGARQQGREWLLLVYYILFEDREVLLVRSEAAGGKASIAIHQFMERSVGAELALGQNWMRRGKFHPPEGHPASTGPHRASRKESFARRILLCNTT